jgi:hypothetical protein
MSNGGEIMSTLNKLIEAHGADHMCDACINARKRKEIIERQVDEARVSYERLRGGAIGSISVSDAIKGRKP